MKDPNADTSALERRIDDLGRAGVSLFIEAVSGGHEKRLVLYKLPECFI